jgi:hypothetical protein
MSVLLKEITEDQFNKDFKLIENHIDLNASFDNCMFETFGLELLFVTEMSELNRVITIIESDGDELDKEGYLTPNMYYASGMHHVNRIGYLITEEPIEYEFECKID